MLFRARQFEFRFPRPALVMGVINVTPDSFSDGGRFFSPAKAVAHALELVAQGAEILDIGGESTRPGAEPVGEAEELRRVIPVIRNLAEQLERGRPARANLKRKLAGEPPAIQPRFAISIDTMKPAVARAALDAGASMVNDVAAARRAGSYVRSSAFRRSTAIAKANRLKAELQTDAMWKVVAEFRAGYICMHAQGSPRTMQKNPAYRNVVREVSDFFRERLERLNAAGISSDQIVFDPGIGFGKTLEHNLQLLANLRRFTKLRRPLLLGVSRKSFIGKLLGATLNERLPASLACATLAVADGAQIIRAHDVAETVQAVRLAEALLARRKK
jgi:dihydropteroate synthase